MSLKVAFQMEPMSEANPEKNSSLVIMEEAQKRGHTVYQYAPNEITLGSEGVFAQAREVKIDRDGDNFYSLDKDVVINLLEVDVVLMRQDPPFNMEYMTATYMLEAVRAHTMVVNDPFSVRNAPEKIFPFAFSKYMPETIITEHLEAAKSFLELKKKIIIKPLYMFGGQGVSAFEEGDVEDLIIKFNLLLDKYEAPVVVQKFIPEVTQGDKRILLIDGEVAGAFLRIPQAGSIKANLMAGGSLEKTELTDRDVEICEALKIELKERKFMICGIDIIGGYLTEINVTSPIGFLEIDNLYGKNVAATLWDKIEEVL